MSSNEPAGSGIPKTVVERLWRMPEDEMIYDAIYPLGQTDQTAMAILQAKALRAAEATAVTTQSLAEATGKLARRTRTLAIATVVLAVATVVLAVATVVLVMVALTAPDPLPVPDPVPVDQESLTSGLV